MFLTILVVHYIVAIWQIHKVTPSIMSFMNSHCGSNFTAESWKYSTQTHTSHTRVLYGELSWEGKQFHLRELWRPTLGRLEWSRATEAGCILMTGCLCRCVLGRKGAAVYMYVCMYVGVKGRPCYCRASEIDGVFSGEFEQEWVKGLQRRLWHTENSWETDKRPYQKSSGMQRFWHMLCCYRCLILMSYGKIHSNMCSLDAAIICLLTIYDSEAKNNNL